MPKHEPDLQDRILIQYKGGVPRNTKETQTATNPTYNAVWPTTRAINYTSYREGLRHIKLY